MSGRPAREHPRATAAVTMLAVSALVGLVLVIATWAASSGPDPVFEGAGPNPDRISTSDPTTTPTEPVPPPPPLERRGNDEPPGWIAVVARIIQVLLVVLVAAGVAALLWFARKLRWRPRRRRRVEDDPDFEVVDPVSAVADAMAEDADEQRRVLAEGSPRNGIVECWHRFEGQAERAGVPRQQWETSSEFTLRLLDLVEADASAVARLATLYRLARFSDHELVEADRASALEALELIHRQLGSLLGKGDW